VFIGGGGKQIEKSKKQKIKKSTIFKKKGTQKNNV
jgi:hypothetical protein